ncbi:DUF937 domain-containing protein [Agrobacterium sp. ES01]|uniref:DUF937 domain-containing protein n=1 Tax=Agrobacterium sp. ES01 TaxID=3420714 RepID=UPI003D1441F0
MLPLFEMMMRAQNGTAMEAMAKQFNLAQEQTTKAMAALMPAFSSGFKRNASNPMDFSALLSSMTSGNYAKYFEDMNKAFTPQGMADGNNVLETLFGSKEVSRAIAAQAAQMTGIGQDVLKQMMPAMADAIMGGLFKQATGQMQNGSDAFTNSPMGQMMQQWLESTGFSPKAKAPEPANFFDNPFTKAFQDMMAGSAKPQAGANPFMDNPFMKAFQDMMPANGAKPAEPSTPDAAPEDAEPQDSGAANPFSEMMNSMFDSGLEVQKSYQKNMEQILDTYMKVGEGKAGSSPSKAGKAKPSKD